MGGTIRALREGGVPVAHRFVGVARQRGSSRGTLHSDHRNYMLSTLTPLVVPGPCGVLGRSRAPGGLEYQEEERRLEPGETVILDNSFPHQVYNDAEADRFVLMCEVWHPALTPGEREAMVTLLTLTLTLTLTPTPPPTLTLTLTPTPTATPTRTRTRTLTLTWF